VAKKHNLNTNKSANSSSDSLSGYQTHIGCLKMAKDEESGLSSVEPLPMITTSPQPPSKAAIHPAFYVAYVSRVKLANLQHMDLLQRFSHSIQ
jgi:hypothetical protein